MLRWPAKRPRLRLSATAAVAAVSSSLASFGPAGIVPAAATTSPFCPSAGTVCVSYANQWFEPFPGGAQAVHIFGLVHNETSDNVTLIRVNLTLPSGTGTVPGTAWSSLDVLAPGQSAPFEAIVAPSPYSSTSMFTISGVSFARSTASPYSHLTVPTLGSCSWAPTNPDVLCGTVLNSGTGAVYVHDVHVALTFKHKDASNNEVMVAQNRVAIDPIPNADPTLNDTLAPGDSGTFTIDRTGDPSYDALFAVAEPTYPLDLSRDSLDFGNQLVNTPSVAQSVRVINNGNRDVSIAISTPADFPQTNDCGAILGVGFSCNVSVQFKPSAIGDEIGAFLTISTNEAGSPDTVHLLGTGIAPRVSLTTPNGKFFGTVALGQSSALLPVVLSNTGNATLTYSIGLSADLTLVQPNACNGTLPQLQSCTMNLIFTPAVPFWSFPTLTLTDNAPDHQQQLTFSGYGVGPALAFNPPSLDFGDTLVPTSQKTVLLINTGNADLIINSISTTGPFAATPCAGTPLTLAAGKYCSVTVAMISGGVGAATGFLVVADNAGGHVMFMSGSLVGTRTPSQGPLNSRTGPPPPVAH